MRKLINSLLEELEYQANKAFEKADNYRLYIDNKITCYGEDYKETTEYAALIFKIECNMAWCHICDTICKLK